MPKVSKVNQLPKKFPDSDFVYQKEEPKPKESYWVYPLYVSQLKKLKLTPQPSLDDAQLNNFLSNVADPNNFEKQIVHFIRIRAIDRLHKEHNKKKEFLIYYQNWYGFDAQGHKLPSVADYPQGLDKQVMHSTSLNSDGTSENKIEDEYFVHTIEFSAKKVEDAIESSPETDIEKCQFSVLGIGRSYSGFSYEEFTKLGYDELVERGRTGQVNFPVDNEILEKQRELEVLREKKRSKK
jgi:hypothetical protein